MDLAVVVSGPYERSVDQVSTTPWPAPEFAVPSLPQASKHYILPGSQLAGSRPLVKRRLYSTDLMMMDASP